MRYVDAFGLARRSGANEGKSTASRSITAVSGARRSSSYCSLRVRNHSRSLFRFSARLQKKVKLPIACFGHAGDGNIHVNIMVPAGDEAQRARAGVAERELFTRVVALEGSISGEHGIGFAKAPFLRLELSETQIALMQRVKAAFDPHGILNPGKIFHG